VKVKGGDPRIGCYWNLWAGSRWEDCIIYI
jgi:hypothetical protein